MGNQASSTATFTCRLKCATWEHRKQPVACTHVISTGADSGEIINLPCMQAELAAVMLANRAAIVPLIPKVLADLPAQREAAAHRDACAACVRDYHMVSARAGLFCRVRAS